jgi:hypothetical protein
MEINMQRFKEWPLVRPLIALLFSRKFLVVLLAALASLGLDLTPEVKALIFAIGGIVIAVTTAWEDAALKRGGG